MGVLRTVLLVLVGASSAAAADKKFLRVGLACLPPRPLRSACAEKT